MTTPPIGTQVEVWSEDETEHLGIGHIVGYERVTTLGETIRIKHMSPIIKMPDGCTVRGFECVFDMCKKSSKSGEITWTN